MEVELAYMKEQLKQSKKWEPKAGNHFVNINGLIYPCLYHRSSGPRLFGVERETSGPRLFGVERETSELANKARDQMRVFNRLLAYVHEYAPDYEPNWSDTSSKWYVYYTSVGIYELASIVHGNTLGVVYMPKPVALALVQKLNSGEVIL
jgi:hypothetical protein